MSHCHQQPEKKSKKKNYSTNYIMLSQLTIMSASHQLVCKWNLLLYCSYAAELKMKWSTAKTGFLLRAGHRVKLIGCEEDVVFGENVEKGVNCAENTLDYEGIQTVNNNVRNIRSRLSCSWLTIYYFCHSLIGSLLFAWQYVMAWHVLPVDGLLGISRVVSYSIIKYRNSVHYEC